MMSRLFAAPRQSKPEREKNELKGPADGQADGMDQAHGTNIGSSKQRALPAKTLFMNNDDDHTTRLAAACGPPAHAFKLAGSHSGKMAIQAPRNDDESTTRVCVQLPFESVPCRPSRPMLPKVRTCRAQSDQARKER